MMNRRAWFAFGIIAVVFGAIVWGIMFSFQSEIRELRENGVRADARVVDKYTKTDHNKITHAYLEVTFLDGSDSEAEQKTKVNLLTGEINFAEPKIGSFQRTKVTVLESENYDATETGKTVSVTYLAEDRSEGRLTDEVANWRPGMKYYLVTGVFALAAVFCFVAGLVWPMRKAST